MALSWKFNQQRCITSVITHLSLTMAQLTKLSVLLRLRQLLIVPPWSMFTHSLSVKKKNQVQCLPVYLLKNSFFSKYRQKTCTKNDTKNVLRFDSLWSLIVLKNLSVVVSKLCARNVKFLPDCSAQLDCSELGCTHNMRQFYLPLSVRS